MFTKTLITVALIVAAISSSASAATVKEAASLQCRACLHGTWIPTDCDFDDGTEL